MIPNNETKSRETIGKIIEFYEKSIIHQKSIVEIRVIATTELPPYIENPGFFAETGALLKRLVIWKNNS